MEQWIEIRRRVLNGELSKRAACAEYSPQVPDDEPRLIANMLQFVREFPRYGYRR